MKKENNLEGNIKPFSEGWKNLPLEKRLDIWWNQHKDKMGNQAQRYKTFLENFTMGYDEASLEAYLNFKYDLRLYQYQHPGLLLEGFYAIYNTSEAKLGAKGSEPKFRLTAYMKGAEQYFASKKEAEAEKEHYEAMEGLEPMNMYVIEQVQPENKKY